MWVVRVFLIACILSATMNIEIEMRYRNKSGRPLD